MRRKAGISMKNYENEYSGIVMYEIGDDYIDVCFREATVYRYTYDSTGAELVEQMKELATNNKGLSGFISRNVKANYDSKWVFGKKEESILLVEQMKMLKDMS